MPSVRHKRLPHLISLTLIFYFWVVGLAALDRFPKIFEDEAWIAAPGYTFWEQGIFGTDLFAGFYGMERHYYDFPPLFSMMVGGGLHLFGMGLFQARIVPLILMTLTLALTYRLGTRLFSPWHGALAVATLVTWRLARPTPTLVSGIPLADIARIVRYDAAVPLFGLLASLLLVKAARKPRLRYFAGCGFLAGLATLSHLYGALWIPALLAAEVYILKSRALRPALVTSAGFGLALAPWLVFVASGWDDFVHQYRIYTSRFNLLDSRFYALNISGEIERYRPVLDALQGTFGARLGMALLVIGLLWLIRQAVRPRDPAAQLLAATVTLLCGLFALLLSAKTFSYLATLWPLFALVIAAGWVRVWRLTTRRAWQMGLTILFAGAIAEGVVATGGVQRVAQQVTPYKVYTDSIAGLLPPNSHVLALQHYWLGLAEHTANYRSFLAPVNWTNAQYVDRPISFEEAAQAFPPDIILLDQVMLNFLRQVSNPASSLHFLGDEIRDYLRDRHARMIGEVRDSTYGLTQVFQLDSDSG